MDGKIFKFLFLTLTAMVTAQTNDPAADQLILYKNKTTCPVPTMTTSSGRPVDRRDTCSLNKRLIFDDYFMDRVSHYVREKIPERVMSSKGAGAFGYFEVTHNVTDICKVKAFNKIGKRTPIAMRFSSLAVERGGSDLYREPKGFAVKLYTEDGILDYAGLNIPVYGVKDPLHGIDYVKSAKRNPATNLLDPNMFWDFATLNPETFHSLLYVFSDRGIPDGYRHMAGYSIHTYQLVNDCGESVFVRFNSIPDGGFKYICSEEAKRLSAEQPDYAAKDLYNAIANGENPSWTVYLQVMSMEDMKRSEYDIFDVTRTIPEDQCKTRKLGRLVLNRNAENHVAEIEYMAISPGNLVSGILGSPDKTFEARLIAYREAHAYRLGGNANKIPVNCPFYSNTYNRDGQPPVNDNGGDGPIYYPNSFKGPAPIEENRVELVEIHEQPSNNFGQIRELYLSFSEDEQQRIIENILSSSLKESASFIQKRAVRLFGLIDENLGNAIEDGLNSKPCN